MPNGKYRSRYEKTRILSARSLQIAQGSPVLVKVPKKMVEPLRVAQEEWKRDVIPIDIRWPDSE